MMLLLFFQLGFPFPGIGSAVWQAPPIAGTYLIAPNIEALNDTSIGQVAFDRCVGLGGNSWTCESERIGAMMDDDIARYRLFFADLAAGRIRSDRTLNIYLAKYKLFLRK